jgi:hypothetical protein
VPFVLAPTLSLIVRRLTESNAPRLFRREATFRTRKVESFLLQKKKVRTNYESLFIKSCGCRRLGECFRRVLSICMFLSPLFRFTWRRLLWEDRRRTRTVARGSLKSQPSKPNTSPSRPPTTHFAYRSFGSYST